MFEDQPSLCESYTWEPVHEVRDDGAILKVLEEGGDGDSGSAKHPRTADPLRICLDR